MQNIVIILCLTGLAASGVITNRPRLNLNSIQGTGNGVGRLYTMTRNELLRQKFILDVLMQVELPMLNHNMMQLRLEGIADENLYMGPLDDDMILVLDLIRTNRMLGRNDICSVSSEQHLRQMIGLYRLFVRCRDFETLQRIAVYARKNVNPVLFVNALTLALEDRVDTQMLVVPAIYEILPRLYNEDSIIRVVENDGRGVGNINTGSVRPNIMNVIEMGRNGRFMNSRRSERGNLGGVIDRSQLWMPWREMHRQLGLQKSLGGRVIIYDQAKQDISVRPISQGVGINKRIGLIAEDVGLRSFLNILLDELILKQDIIRRSVEVVNNDRSAITNNIRETGIKRLVQNDVDISRERRLLQDQHSIHNKEPIRSNSQLDTNREDLWNSVLNNNQNRPWQMNLRPLTNANNDGRNTLVDTNTRDKYSRGMSSRNPQIYWIRINRGQRTNDILNGDSVSRNDGDLGDNISQNWNNIGARQDPIIGERVQNTNGDDLRHNNILTLKNLGSTDESDWVNAHLVNGVVNDRMLLGDNLPITLINNDRLLHVGGRRLNLVRDNVQNNGLDDVLLNKDRLHSRANSNLGRMSGIGGGTRVNDNWWSTDGQREVDKLTTQRGDIQSLLEDDINTSQRVPRSLNGIVNDDMGTRIGQLILHHMQQVVARLNIEQISLQKTTNDMLNMDVNNIRLSNGIVRGMVNDIRLDERSTSVVVAKMNEISDRLEKSMQQVMQHLSNRQSWHAQINAVDQILPQQIALAEVLLEVMNLSEYVHGGQLSNILENSTTQLLLRHIINTVDQQLQKLKRDRPTGDVAFNGVSINNLKVGGLHTFVEDVDIDLGNMVAADNERDRKMVVGRMPRLNHKSFAINMDLTSDRNQRVVVRTLLGPKTDVMGRPVSLDQQRQNFVLLDIANVDLREGRNVVQRKSSDISWTGRDITPYSEIYERVMRALQGDVDLTNNPIVGQTNLLPHRLLIPRGRIDGLPMQLLVVITPAVYNGNRLRQDMPNLMGMDSLLLDNLPILYPMDRDVADMNTLLSLPNVCLKDVVIYHDEQIKRLPQ